MGLAFLEAAANPWVVTLGLTLALTLDLDSNPDSSPNPNRNQVVTLGERRRAGSGTLALTVAQACDLTSSRVVHTSIQLEQHTWSTVVCIQLDSHCACATQNPAQ